MKQVVFLILLVSHGSLLAQQFTLANQESNIIFNHINDAVQQREATVIAAGGAVADYNFDGYPDFYLLGGSNQSNALFKNNGDGTFTNVANQAGVDLFDILGSGPSFADVDGDADLDLLVLSVQAEDQPVGSDDDLLENRPRLFINQNDGTFIENLATSGFDSGMPSYSGTFGDIDQDGDLDLFMTHWTANGYTISKQLFWENDGNGQFTDVTIDYLGLTQNNNTERFTFTPYITDIDEDGLRDVLVTSDFGTTRIFLQSNLVNTFSQSQPAVITDENGMGSAVADYDNDGDLDWFVTSIWDPNGEAEANWGVSGNRLYRNTGNGVFEDATDEAGVREGYWGWGACFADFNNDGYLDIYHENGFPNAIFAQEFINDPSRLFMSDGDGTFTEQSAASGLNYTGQGRGISCVDYDLDGDLDIMIMPNDDSYQLYKNITNNGNNYLDIHLFDTGANPYALNAKIQVDANSMVQTREVSSSNNFVSNNPLQQHFGLGQATTINNIQITWPDGVQQTINSQLNINQITSISRYCHTKFLHKVATDTNSENITVYLHDLSGNPIAARSVTMTVEKGPNAGHTQNLNTGAQGDVTFALTPNSAGTDRIKFSFTESSDTQICRSLVRWFDDLIFIDGFEQ